MAHRAPDFALIIAGQDVSNRFRPRLNTLALVEKRGGEADQLDLTLDDSDGRLAIPPKGAVITLALGWRGEALVGKGAFRIDEVSHSGAPDVLRITARSADFTSALKTRRDGSWRAATLGQVLEEVAGRNGLTPRIAADLAAVPVEVLQQSRESDAALLARLGRQHDAAYGVKAGALVFSRRGSGRTATGKPLPGFVITRADGDRHDWKSAARDGDYTGVVASWHDMASGQRRRVTVGSASKVRRLKKVYANEGDARRAAEAQLRKSTRGADTLVLDLAEGRPELYPEMKGRVEGFKPSIDGSSWLIDEIRHGLGDAGLSTSLQLELA